MRKLHEDIKDGIILPPKANSFKGSNDNTSTSIFVLFFLPPSEIKIEYLGGRRLYRAVLLAYL